MTRIVFRPTQSIDAWEVYDYKQTKEYKELSAYLRSVGFKLTRDKEKLRFNNAWTSTELVFFFMDSERVSAGMKVMYDGIRTSSYLGEFLLTKDNLVQALYKRQKTTQHTLNDIFHRLEELSDQRRDSIGHLNAFDSLLKPANLIHTQKA